MKSIAKNVVYVLIAIVISLAVFNAFSEKPAGNTTEVTTIRDHKSYITKYEGLSSTYAQCGAVYTAMNHDINKDGLDDLALGAFETCALYGRAVNLEGGDVGNPVSYCKAMFESTLTYINSASDRGKVVVDMAKPCADTLYMQTQVMRLKGIPVPSVEQGYSFRTTVPTNEEFQNEDCPVRGESEYGKVC